MQAVTDNVDLEDFSTRSVTAHSIEKGYLHLLVELDSGEFLLVPCDQLKKDYPLMLARCTLAHDAGRVHKKWAQNILKNQRRTICCLNFAHGVDEAFHVKI